MNNLSVSSSPHIRDKSSANNIMYSVILALVPALAAGVIIFGIRSLFVALFSMCAAAFFEGAWQLFTKQKVSIYDGSALVTGLLLALCLPASIPLWIVLTGDFVAIIIVKQFFGGLGHNFMNPALTARAFMLAAWPVPMTSWVQPFSGMDAVSGATVLEGGSVSLADAFWGNMAGCIGEVCAAALLLGGLFLILKKIIKIWVPLSCVLTVYLCSLFAGQDALLQILSGGLLLGAFFMATDYVTSPVTMRGQIIMGLGCGLVTFIIRYWGGYPEGITYAVLLMNAATPLIDKVTQPKRYGGGKVNA